MHFVSCRDTTTPPKRYTFEEAISLGWAEDGGMILPEQWPQLTTQQVLEWRNKTYAEVAIEIMSLFIDPTELSKETITSILQEAFQVFGNEDIVTYTSLEANFQVCELWHGPTLAFKDLGMQVLVAFLEYFLRQKQQTLTLLVGTSGDTGSAAIEAVRKTSNMNIVVLYPKGRISFIQEMQMNYAESLSKSNVKVIAVDGTSDDLDEPIEAIFANDTIRQKYNVGSVNSVNICRILMQTVHYIYSMIKFAPNLDKKVTFCVPTGAGGHITAGMIARKMGLHKIQLYLCTNENDILHRLFETGAFQTAEHVKQTNSPSMDIQIPYNIERMFYLYTDGNASQVKQWIQTFKSTGNLVFSLTEVNEMKESLGILATNSYTTKQVEETMRLCYTKDNYVLDPHTAVGVCAYYHSKKIAQSDDVVAMACAHPAKFKEILAHSFNKSLNEAMDMIPDQTHPCVAAVIALNSNTIKQEKIFWKDTQSEWVSLLEEQLKF